MHMCYVDGSLQTTSLWKDWKRGATFAIILLQNIKKRALERTSKYATLYNHFFLYSTKFVPNTDTVFCFGIFTILPNEKIRNHPRKPEDLVKNLGDYESEFRIPRGQPCVTELTIIYTIPTHTYQNPEK